MPALNYNFGNFLKSASALSEDEIIREKFLGHIAEKDFPCVIARAALGLQTIDTFVAGHLACPADDAEILDFIYRFVDRLRNEPAKFRSAVVLFRDERPMTDGVFDRFLWSRLQALADLDRTQYQHDARVSSDPSQPDFSFSLKEEAFYIIGMHPGSNRPARRSASTALVFNAHVQFDQLRREGKYSAIQNVIRKRDLAFSGSVNPMLSDFGERSEAMQYSGLMHENGWTCPLHFKNDSDGNYSPS